MKFIGSEPVIRAVYSGAWAVNVRVIAFFSLLDFDVAVVCKIREYSGRNKKC